MEYLDPIEQIVGKETKIKLGLERMEQMMALLGHPEQKFKAVHIAGSNGKGSVAAMVASILQQAGFKTGLYTSPHLSKVNERIKVDGRDIDDKTLQKEIESLTKLIEENNIEASYYEFVTALAFKHFADQKVDFVVAEVGLGGRLDATNVLPAPLVCAVTNIGLEHQEFLGETLEEIATEKMQIIKKESFVVTGVKDKNILELIQKKCEQENAGLLDANEYNAKVLKRSRKYQEIQLGEETFELSLLGDFQLPNAAVALGCVEGLKLKGVPLPSMAAHNGFKNVKWPARFEVYKKDVLLVFDSAHNPDGIKALVESLRSYFPGEKFQVIFGASQGRDVKVMLETLKEVSSDLITFDSGHPKAVPSINLAETALQAGFKNAEVKDNARQAMTKALNSGKPVCVCGSVYLVAKVRSLLAPLTST